MKMTSRIALVAAAGFLIGATTSAKAADLGSGCCADLEERVAELEATTARKGNRVVSLQVYGQVNKALLFWDDGDDSDVFVVDNDQSGGRIGLKGTTSIKPGLIAGYVLEFNFQDSATDTVSQFDDEGNPNEISIRHNYLYIDSEQLGRVSLGQQSAATDGISEIILANTLSDSSDIFGKFKVRGAGSDTISDFVNDFDGPREDVIRYDTPSIYGFIVSASWGDNDFYDVALRFSKEWNSIRIAAGIGYQNFSQNSDTAGDDFEIVSGSASVMHVPTGLFLSGSAGEQDFDDPSISDGNFWFLQGGIEKRFLSYGATTVYGEFGQYDDINFDGSQVDRWGFGVVQQIDSAAMDLYVNVRNYDFGDNGVSGKDRVNFDDFTSVLVGSRIKF